MLDKVDLQIPEGTLPGPLFAPLYSQLRHHLVEPFRPSRFYHCVGDLRKTHNIDAIVSLGYRRGRETHKVEIVDAGKKSLEEIADIIRQLFQVDPWTLRVMRVDLAADVQGVPVPWFQQHVLVERKQFTSRIAKGRETEVQFVFMGTAKAQTIYAGKRPNVVRIYDKGEELKRSWLKHYCDYERFNAGMKKFEMTKEQEYYGQRIPPTFDEYCRVEGFEYSEGDILTRVERQAGGDRIPDELATLGDLRKAHLYDPFQYLKLLGGEVIRPIGPPSENTSVRDVLGALGFETLVKELGSASRAVAYVKKHGKGNGKRILEGLKNVLPRKRHPLTIEEIVASYRESTIRQIPNRFR